MNTLKLRPMTDAEIQYWYTTEFQKDFNPQERKPLSYILSLKDSRCYDLLGLFQCPHEQMLGYATIWKSIDTDLLLLDYLGVSSNLRNKGLGSELLSLLKEYYKDRYIIVESELPVPGDNVKENLIRERRIAFYKRNGFQAVYKMATCGMAWQALLLGALCPLDPSEITTLMHNHKTLYGPLRKDVKIPLEPEESLDMPYWIIEH